MNGKKARRLRRLLRLDLSSGSEDKDHGVAVTGGKIVAQIQPDGNHTTREKPVVEARTTEERYLYRELKKVYNRPQRKPEVRKHLAHDLKEEK